VTAFIRWSSLLTVVPGANESGGFGVVELVIDADHLVVCGATMERALGTPPSTGRC